MERRIVDGEITLVPYYPNYKASLPWYQDADVCKQVDNRNSVYDLKLLKAMYRYLNARGSLFYIKYRGRLCGDVCLHPDGEINIVVAKSFQNKHIGRRTSPNCTRRSTRSMRSRSGCLSAPDSTRPATSCTKWNYNFQIEKAPAR